MSETDERTRAQLTDLFTKTESASTRLTKIEVNLDNLEKIVTKTAENVDAMSKAHNKAHLYLFGDKETGHDGILTIQKDQGKAIGKHEAIIVKAAIGIATTVFLLKYLGYWDKLLG